MPRLFWLHSLFIFLKSLWCYEFFNVLCIWKCIGNSAWGSQFNRWIFTTWIINSIKKGIFLSIFFLHNKTAPKAEGIIELHVLGSLLYFQIQYRMATQLHSFGYILAICIRLHVYTQNKPNDECSISRFGNRKIHKFIPNVQSITANSYVVGCLAV